jgi:hypothetical protein
MNSTQKGTLAEAIIVARFVAKGYTVSLPFGGGARYDFIADDGSRLLRVQCKMAKCQRGNIVCRAYSTTARRGGQVVRTGYLGAVDVFALYEADSGRVYVVPVERAARAEIWLRTEPHAIKTGRTFKLAVDYEF